MRDRLVCMCDRRVILTTQGAPDRGRGSSLYPPQRSSRSRLACTVAVAAHCPAAVDTHCPALTAMFGPHCLAGRAARLGAAQLRCATEATMLSYPPVLGAPAVGALTAAGLRRRARAWLADNSLPPPQKTKIPHTGAALRLRTDSWHGHVKGKHDTNPLSGSKIRHFCTKQRY